ncbi:MAG: FkbM family methyltransferase [Cyclobacteriaceae bacterium]|nr:FkbM family methyltransferase [Cyclobacteriaceae bacterium]
MIQLFYKIIYYPPVNKLLLFINRAFSKYTAFRLPPSGTIEIKINKSASFKMMANQTSYVHKLLYWNGPLQFEYTPIFIELIKHCKVFIDVGSNTGYYSLLASKCNPQVKVFAFEPARGPLHYINKNILLNNLQTQIEIQDIALSNQSGEVKFYEVRNKKYLYLKYNLSGVGSLTEDVTKRMYPVMAFTLDKFIWKTRIKSVDLIKIDTEGTENKILEGASEIIRKFHPIIICEILFNKIENDLETIMKEHGYLFFAFEKNNKRLKQLNSLTRLYDNGVRDCFFVHPTKISTMSDLHYYLL